MPLTVYRGEMYKDKARQREANRQAARRYRAKKGMTQGMTQQGVTAGESIIPKSQSHTPAMVGYVPSAGHPGK